MKINTWFPGLIPGRVARSKGTKAVLCLGEIEFDIPEYAEAEFPLAYTLLDSSGDVETEYRLLSGSLHACAGPVSEVLSEDGLRTTVSKTHALFGGMVRAIERLAKDRLVAEQTYPPTLSSALSGRQDQLKGLADYGRDIRGLLVDPEGVERQMGVWRVEALRMASGLVIMGGELWVQCEPPVFVATPGKGTVEAMRGPERELRLPGLQAVRSVGGCGTMLFPPEELWRAVEAARNTTGQAAQTGGIVCHFDEPLTPPMDVSEFDRYARATVFTLGRHLINNARAAHYLRMPMEAMRTFSRLRVGVAAYSDAAEMPDGIEALYEGVLDACTRHPEWAATVIGLDVPTMRLVFERWLERDMSIELGDAPALLLR